MESLKTHHTDDRQKNILDSKVASILLVVIYIAAFGIFQFEHDAQPDKFTSIIDALWWSVATITTVGYGDIYPITLAGRLFTFVIMLASLGLISIPAGIFASALISVKSDPAQINNINHNNHGEQHGNN